MPYTGCTNDLKSRLEKHNNAYVPATKTRLPVKLITYLAFANKHTAFSFEKYLKSGSGRAFMKKHEFIEFNSEKITNEYLSTSNKVG